MSHGVLGDLHQDGVTTLKRELDALGLAVEARSVPVDLARVEHRVAAATDVDEGRLHAGEHVLHAAEVDVAHHRTAGAPIDIVLDQHAVFEHRDLGAPVLLPHDHHPVDVLTPGEELGFGEDRSPASASVAAIAAALLLGLEAGGATHRGDVLARRPNPGDRIGRVVGRCVIVGPCAPTASAPTSG